MPLGGLSHADNLQYLVLVIVSADCIAVSIANNHRPKKRLYLSLQFPKRLTVAEDSIKYSPRTGKKLFMDVCLFREMKYLTQPSLSRIVSAMPAQTSDELHEDSVAQQSNALTRVLARFFV